MMPRALCALADLGTLRFHGADARSFLQGQLSNDLSALRPGALLRAGLHNPQGRTLAVLALLAGSGPDEVLAVLPRELLSAVTATLQRYVLRAKVKINDVSAQHSIYGTSAAEAHESTSRTHDGATIGIYSGYAPGRGLMLAPSGDALPAGTTLSRSEWRALDIAAGLPQLYQSTSGEFVAQMLNLDCIDAISFTKGCYTGQEVIARAHYRGRVKRRMQRFLSASALELAPGAQGLLADGRSVRIVDASVRVDGCSEFLAVAALHAADGDSSAATAASPASAPIEAQSLPLPYALPE